jgi:hypothetical protein
MTSAACRGLHINNEHSRGLQIALFIIDEIRDFQIYSQIGFIQSRITRPVYTSINTYIIMFEGLPMRRWSSVLRAVPGTSALEPWYILCLLAARTRSRDWAVVERRGAEGAGCWWW